MSRVFFEPDSILRATFVDRPNRFLVRCRLPEGKRIQAFLPNPGRLSELLLPETPLRVVESAKTDGTRKTRFTVAAVEREGTPIFLDTHLTNAVARYLLEAGRVPGLAGAKIIRAEAPVGRSRFDFLLEEGGRPMYLEVKSVTFFGGRVAMFPDAITARGRRHLIELAELSRAGTRTAVLFVVHHPDIDWFMPDYHTDLAFSKTFLAVRDAVEFHPVSVRWRRDLTLADKVKPVAIPWEYLEREVADRGAYILLLHLKRRRRVRVGELGVFTFPKGHYLYVGSAMRNLTARIARHERRRKRLHWHIDYLREAADSCTALPIHSSRREECAIANALGGLFQYGPTGFGASDCACPAHLFYAAADPLEQRAFHDVLQDLRMRLPERSANKPG